MKPFKGEIHDWVRIDGNSNTSEPVEGQPHLNFIIRGVPVGHPKFRGNILTSAVVMCTEIPRHANEPRRIEIETFNSRYVLIGEGTGELP